MKAKLLLLFAALGLATALMWVDERHGAAVNQVSQSSADQPMAPKLMIPPLAGGEAVPLSSFHGRWVLINVWASWCTPCAAEFPDLLALAKETPEKLQLVTLTVDRTRAAAEGFLQRFDSAPANVLHGFDGNQALSRDMLQVYRYPESVLVSPEGQMVRKFAGVLTEVQLREIRQLVR